jgi:hypothetical protein
MKMKINPNSQYTQSIFINVDSDVADKIDAILHLNIFLPNDNEHSYIEIGILISRKEYNNFDRNFNIEIVFPFGILKEEFADVKDRLCDGKTLNMIFNEETHLDKNKLDFRLRGYKLGGIKLCNTTINGDSSITMSVEEKQKNSYFRFRIRNIRDKITDTVLSDTMANPFIKTIKTIGISINLDRQFIKQINKKIKFKEINTFIILDSITELIEKSRPIKSFRVLEDNLWNQYIGSYANRRMTVYQFKDKTSDDSTIENYQLFLKSLHHKNSNLYRYKFLLIVVVVAIISNAIYDLLKWIFLC